MSVQFLNLNFLCKVLQKPLDLELELFNDGGNKDKTAGPCARLSIVQVSSTPVDQQDHKTDRDFRSVEIHD